MLSPEILKLLGSTKKDVDQDKDGENVPKLECVGVVLVYYSLVNNNYQQALKVLLAFVPNEQFEQLINIAPHSLIMLSTTNTEFSSIKVWFTDQNSQSLEIEDSVRHYKNDIFSRTKVQKKRQRILLFVICKKIW